MPVRVSQEAVTLVAVSQAVSVSVTLAVPVPWSWKVGGAACHKHRRRSAHAHRCMTIMVKLLTAGHHRKTKNKDRNIAHWHSLYSVAYISINTRGECQGH